MALVPPSWLQADWQHGHEPRPAAERGGQQALQALLPSLGWQLGGHPIPLTRLKVRQGTRLQLQQSGQPERRSQRLAEFAALAGGSPLGNVSAQLAADAAPPPSPTSQPMPVDDAAAAAQMIRRLWKLRWSNHHKEVYWRLALNGLPMAARMGGNGAPCGCGHAGADRRHHFWECPAAAAVINSLMSQLGPEQQITTRNLWLGLPPAGVHAGVWDVVCLAAIVAMDLAKRRMTGTILAESDQSTQPGLGLVEAAAMQAVTRFWSLLQDFCTLAVAPPEWQALVTEGHPFFYWEPKSLEWIVSPPLL